MGQPVILVQNYNPLRHVVLSDSKKKITPKQTFTSGASDIYETFDLHNPKDHTSLRGVLIFDKGERHRKLAEVTLKLTSQMTDGDFDFSRPSKGWAPGPYHIEIWSSSRRLTSTPFKVVKGADQLVANVLLTDSKVTKSPKGTFRPDDTDIYEFFDLNEPKDDTSLRGVLICDKCAVAPPHTEVVETTLKLTSQMDSGDFHFSKPTKGWPVGDYHVEIWSGKRKLVSTPFKVVNE